MNVLACGASNSTTSINAGQGVGGAIGFYGNEVLGILSACVAAVVLLVVLVWRLNPSPVAAE